MIGCILARRWSQVSPARPAIGIFTSLLLLVILLNLDAFDFDLTPVWVWTRSYIVYPAIAFTLAWTARRRRAPVVGSPQGAGGRVRHPRAPPPPRRPRRVGGARLGVEDHPRPGPVLRRPFLAYAFCSWQYSRRRTWAELSAITPAMLVFTAGTVAVSLVHRELFSTSDLSTWVWFAGFGAAAASLVMSARAVPAGRSRLSLVRR